MKRRGGVKKNPVRGKGRIPFRRNVRRSKFELPERATLTEVLTPGSLLNCNSPYTDYDMSLSVLPRASDVAKGYQYYRIKRITYVFRPLSDTFNAQGLAPGGSVATVPYLYQMVDRTRLFQWGFTASSLKIAGAKARRLDDKVITFSYTPSVLTQTFDNVPSQTAAQYKLCPWLPVRDTNQIGVFAPSTIDHSGMVWIVSQDGTTTPSGYAIERRVQVEFKKPCLPPPPVPPPGELSTSSVKDINDLNAA